MKRDLTLVYPGAGDDYTPLMLAFADQTSTGFQTKREFLRVQGLEAGVPILEILRRVRVVHYIDMSVHGNKATTGDPAERLRDWTCYRNTGCETRPG